VPMEESEIKWATIQVVEALAEQGAKRYVVRDRDAIYGNEFRRRISVAGREGGHQRAPESLAECCPAHSALGCSVTPK
jgi:hypothetical protein